MFDQIHLKHSHIFYKHTGDLCSGSLADETLKPYVQAAHVASDQAKVFTEEGVGLTQKLNHL